MRIKVGPIPRGKDFYPRQHVINKIYRRLDTGSNIYLAAPRRVGKTAIMCYLEDNPQFNFEFKYIITESVNNSSTYFKLLLETLQATKSITKQSVDAIGNFLKRIKELGFMGFKIGIDSRVSTGENPVYFEEFKELIKNLETSENKIVIMIDEFPQTVENIIEKYGNTEAIQFLQFNREIRQLGNEKILFILTGSVGLHAIAEKLDATKEINDLNTLEVPPLTRLEAKDLVLRLINHVKAPYDDQAIEYLLDKTEWFIPFYLQLLIEAMVDEYFENNEKINKEAVDKAFKHITSNRSDAYFSHYYLRLQKNFTKEEYPFALTTLGELTIRDEISTTDLRILCEVKAIDFDPRVLRILVYDGYLFEIQRNQSAFYRFTSPVLRLWWKNYVKEDF